ncbi:MAG: hypothetical protein Q8L36_03690, partial [bacterium]|nr:hypothetical protein [bacterium]
IKKMRKLLLDDKIIFLSVSPFFHRSTDRVKIIERMGHVVLVHGFRSKKGMIEGFFIKDPGGWVENNSQECFVNTNFFLLNYSGRAFIINSINKINKERVLI